MAGAWAGWTLPETPSTLLNPTLSNPGCQGRDFFGHVTPEVLRDKSREIEGQIEGEGVGMKGLACRGWREGAERKRFE